MESIKKWQLMEYRDSIFMDWKYYYYLNSVKQLIDRIRLVKIHYSRKMRIALEIQEIDETVVK